MKTYFIMLIWLVFPYYSFAALPPNLQISRDISEISFIVGNEVNNLKNFQLVRDNGSYKFKYKNNKLELCTISFYRKWPKSNAYDIEQYNDCKSVGNKKCLEPSAITLGSLPSLNIKDISCKKEIFKTLK